MFISSLALFVIARDSMSRSNLYKLKCKHKLLKPSSLKKRVSFEQFSTEAIWNRLLRRIERLAMTECKKCQTQDVYMMTNRSKTLYVGVTNDLMRRVYEHKNGLKEGFTKKYNIDRLVYFEETDNIYDAITAEKKIKGWLRIKKIRLVESANPEWKDLSEGWFEKNVTVQSL